MALGLFVATLGGMVFGGRSWQAFGSAAKLLVPVHGAAVELLLIAWWAAGKAHLFHTQLAVTSTGTALFSAIVHDQLTWPYAGLLLIPVILLGT
jgi:hypothetical protein